MRHTMGSLALIGLLAGCGSDATTSGRDAAADAMNDVEQGDVVEVDADLDALDDIELDPADDVDIDTPPADVGVDTPPADVGVDTPPADVGVDTPPADVGVDTPPADVGVDTPPADVGVDTPAADVGVDTPPADVGVDTPPADVGVDTPPADVGVDTPPADVGFDSGDTSDAGSDTADVGSDVMDAGADTADVTPDVMDVGPDAADAAPDVPDTDMDALDTRPDVPPEGPPIDVASLRAPPYLMWVTEDGVSVRWETSEPVVGEVRYGFAEDERWFIATEDAAATTHEIRLTGLPPATTIWYGVGADSRVTPAASFRTAPEPSTDAAFSFVVWGDNQNGPDVFEDLTPAMADLDPDFGMSTGDCVQNGTRGEYRSQLFDPIAPLGAGVPFLIAAGNHERYSDSGAELFNEYMSQPGDEHCFGWRYGSLYVVFIDTELSVDPGSPQQACIIDALNSEEATSARFQAAAFHKPPRIEWWFGGVIAFPDSMEAPQVREILEPLLEDLGVDIVFNGHNHLYAWTPETPGGITWVTTGGAGGMIDNRGLFDIWRVGTWPQIEVTIHDNHYLYVNVDGETMTVTAVGPDRSPLHEFSITR